MLFINFFNYSIHQLLLVISAGSFINKNSGARCMYINFFRRVSFTTRPHILHGCAVFIMNELPTLDNVGRAAVNIIKTFVNFLIPR